MSKGLDKQTFRPDAGPKTIGKGRAGGEHQDEGQNFVGMPAAKLQDCGEFGSSNSGKRTSGGTRSNPAGFAKTLKETPDMPTYARDMDSIFDAGYPATEEKSVDSSGTGDFEGSTERADKTITIGTTDPRRAHK